MPSANLRYPTCYLVDARKRLIGRCVRAEATGAGATTMSDRVSMIRCREAQATALGGQGRP
jgi:hypothetical protein